LNYSGKFGAELSADGSSLHSNGYVHVETVHATHVPADAIVVPDAHLLFNGEFKRSGVDLILSRDHQELVLHDYFKGEKRAALSSPDGAHLTGDLVNALAGHVEYAQADGSASVSQVIGHVTKLAGTATAIRNGVSIILNNGDNVEKGDVVQSGSDSTLGITFIDGTVFGLSSNARMVLNEMVYDPNGSNNSSLLSLVAGTITFVAGETAKHGDMKVDTPVATMGIRGTAVLVEIDFSIPGPNGEPLSKYQVLVEPDGTTGSYILFDKTTLTPLAVVDKAGQQINISNGILSQTTVPLSPDVQKLISDVFALKFSDNSNTKSLDHHADSITPQILTPIKLASGATATPVILLVNTPVTTTSTTNSNNGSPNQHIDQAPAAAAFGGALTELPGVTNFASPPNSPDTMSGKINFVDINVGDLPTVTAKFFDYTYQNANGTFTSADLNSVFNDSAKTARLAADVAAVEAVLKVDQTPGNTYFGSATWTYTVPDNAFDFLAAGETLTLTYTAFVDNNYAPSDLKTPVKFTITIHGSNDVPVIVTGAQTVTFAAGKTTPGGNLTTNVPTSGSLAFTDVDLTDTHKIVSTDLTSASLSGNGAPTLDKLALEALAPTPMAAFEKALSASVAADSTGTGAGTINWKLADLPVYLADFIPKGEILTLTYTVVVTDSQNATTSQNVVVTITGTDAAAVVWIETTATAPTDAAPGDWNGATNWETGTVPTPNDDAIIITDQLQKLTPFYPVTIKSAGPAAFAKSVTMNDFGSTAPELDNKNSLTIGGGLSLSVDSILKNFGTISVGSLATLLSIPGQAEILDKSVLQNSGVITLHQGGDFKSSSPVTNSGTIEIAGGTLNVESNIANNGGLVQVDNGATLKLSSSTTTSTTITNGHVTLGSGSTLDFESSAGATLDGVTVTGTDAVTSPTVVAANLIEVGATSTATLLLDDGTSIKNGNLTIAAGSTLDIEKGTTAGTPEVTLDGVLVT
jgi:fibronectin-binding autotransporter adhesin